MMMNTCSPSECSKLKKEDDLSNALVIPGLSKEECFQVSDVIALAVIDVQEKIINF